MTSLAHPGTSGTPVLSGRDGFVSSKCQGQGVLRHRYIFPSQETFFQQTAVCTLSLNIAKLLIFTPVFSQTSQGMSPPGQLKMREGCLLQVAQFWRPCLCCHGENLSVHGNGQQFLQRAVLRATERGFLACS